MVMNAFSPFLLYKIFPHATSKVAFLALQPPRI